MYQYQIMAGIKGEDANFKEATLINLTAIDEKQALKKAKGILKCKDYHIRAISEIGDCKEQIKLQEKFLKLMTKLTKKL